MSNNFSRFPISEATRQPHDGFFVVYGNRYWLVEGDNLLFYRGRSPQCNADCRIAQRLAEALPGTVIRHIARVFVPINPGDFTFELPALSAGTKLDLEAIETRCNAATEGPWVSKRDGCTVYGDGGPLRGERSIIATSQRDADFIAHARTDIPALCAALREARAEAEQLKADLAEAAGELLVDLPEPGSDMAKVISANSLLRQRKDKLEAIRSDEERKVTEISGGLETELRALADDWLLEDNHKSNFGLWYRGDQVVRRAADEIERLRTRVAYADSDLEERAYWESRYVEMRRERDEARGDAEREYGLRALAEKERDEARAELAKLRADNEILAKSLSNEEAVELVELRAEVASLQSENVKLRAEMHWGNKALLKIPKLEAIARAAEALELGDFDEKWMAKWGKLQDALAALRSYRTSTEVDASRDSGEGNGQ